MIRIITSSRYKINRKSIHSLVEKMLIEHGILQKYSVSCIFVGKNKMRQIAKTYKKEDVALPVLSFPYKDVEGLDESLLGEVFLCYPQIVLLAAERNKTVEKMILLMVEHGIENLLTN